MADMNLDGKLDLAVTSGGSASVGALLNTTTTGGTSASFAPRLDFTAGSAPEGVSAADLNGDGKPDLVVANAGSWWTCKARSASLAASTSARAAARQRCC